MPTAKLAKAFTAFALTVSALLAQDKPATQPPSKAADWQSPQAEDPDLKMLRNNAQMRPSIMHFCAQHCRTLVWRDGAYVRPDGGTGGASVETWTVKSFTRDSVIINRSDSNGFNALYTGRISGNGDSIVNGEVNGHPDGYRLTWGPALDSIPGTGDPLPEAAVGPTSTTSALDQPLPCNAAFHGSSAEATARGSQALEARKPQDAACWFRIGAKGGDADSEGMLAVLLDKGLGAPVSRFEAAAWAQRSAAQGNYLGERTLSLMYANGDGVEKNASKADYWRAKAERDRLASVQAEQAVVDQRKQQQIQVQAQDRNKQDVQAILMLGLMVGALGNSSGSSGGSGPDALDRLNALHESCSAGFSSSCGKLGMPPSHDH